MVRLMFLMIGLLLMSCKSVKSSTETTMKAESTVSTDLALSTQAEKYRMQHILEDMFIKYNGYKDITIYDTSRAYDSGNGFVAPVFAKVIVRDTIEGEKIKLIHDTTQIIVHDTITLQSDIQASSEIHIEQKESKKPPYDGVLSMFILAVIVVVVYKVCKWLG